MDVQKLSRWQIAGMIIMAPIMGAVFCVFLPFVGFVMVGKVLVEKAVEFMRKRYKQLKHIAGVV